MEHFSNPPVQLVFFFSSHLLVVDIYQSINNLTGILLEISLLLLINLIQVPQDVNQIIQRLFCYSQVPDRLMCFLEVS